MLSPLSPWRPRCPLKPGRPNVPGSPLGPFLPRCCAGTPGGPCKQEPLLLHIIRTTYQNDITHSIAGIAVLAPLTLDSRGVYPSLTRLTGGSKETVHPFRPPRPHRPRDARQTVTSARSIASVETRWSKGTFQSYMNIFNQLKDKTVVFDFF